LQARVREAINPRGQLQIGRGFGGKTDFTNSETIGLQRLALEVAAFPSARLNRHDRHRLAAIGSHDCQFEQT